MSERARLAVSLSAESLLGVAATMLVAAPWLRAFPVSVAGVALLGAAALSVLLPGFTRGRPLAVSIVVSLAGLVAFTLLVVLRGSGSANQAFDGLVHGPSQLLTFALPLVSPRTLLVDPVALTWLAGTVAGIAITRRWSATLPTLALLAAFGLSYAATQRAAGANAVTIETWLAASLLGCLLALRAVQTWRDSQLPMRRALGTSGIAAIGVTVAAALLVQAAFFGKTATVPQRQPTINNTNPLTPLAFIAGLRTSESGGTSSPVFDIQTSVPTTGYVSLANVDAYDGAGWSFDRTFRPSGGVMPTNADGTVHGGTAITQTYRIDSGPLVTGPWMPYLGRPQRVTGATINIDAPSGMIVPSRPLIAGSTYDVASLAPVTTFDGLDAATAFPDATTAAVDTQLPATLHSTLDTIVTALAAETGADSASPMAFLQALQRDFRAHYALVASSAARGATQRAGGTGFSDVLASILGVQRTATPEQYATLTALLARQLGVPARVVTGFRIPMSPGTHSVPAGEHVVRADQAWTWTEVAVSGVGWVVLDTAPTTFRTPSGDQPSGGAVSTPPAALPTQNALITTGNGGNAVAHASRVPHDRGSSGQLLLVLVLGGLGVVLIGGVLLLTARKRIRAIRRRRDGDPARRVSGAWRETIDQLYESRVALPGELDSLTSSEIATFAGRRAADTVVERAAAIGSTAERATFATAVLVRPEDADEAWQQQDDLRRALAKSLPVRRRIAAFTRYHRSDRRQH